MVKLNQLKITDNNIDTVRHIFCLNIHGLKTVSAIFQYFWSLDDRKNYKYIFKCILT